MAQVPIVMVSSTFRDLKAEREGVREVIQGQGMLARMMETDSTIPDRGLLTNSRAMVQRTELFLPLVSNYRYGQVIEDADLNSKRLSITEREFEWAEERGLPMFVFLLDEDVSPTGTLAELAEDFFDLPKLQAFPERARHHSRIIATFRTVAEYAMPAKGVANRQRAGPGVDFGSGTGGAGPAGG